MGLPLQSQNESIGFGRGPPLQGDFVRRVVARPAPTRGRGTSGLHMNATRSDEIPLQRRPSQRGVHRFGAAFLSACRSRDRRSQGHSPGERRGGAGIGRKQAMDGLRSPVGAMDGGTRRCARSPHCRGSPRSQCTPALFDLARPGITHLGKNHSWMLVPMSGACRPRPSLQPGRQAPPFSFEKKLFHDWRTFGECCARDP